MSRRYYVMLERLDDAPVLVRRSLVGGLTARGSDATRINVSGLEYVVKGTVADVLKALDATPPKKSIRVTKAMRAAMKTKR